MDYDLIVIGAGSGGVRCARVAASLGAKVAIIEERYLGGTCVNVGCVPKKLYVYGSHFKEDFDLAKSFGWQTSAPEFSWPVLRDSKIKEVQRLNQIYNKLLEDQGVDILTGHGKIVDPHQVSVDDKIYSTQYILLATGGWPSRPNIPGIEHSITSNEIFDLDRLPKRLTIVGGGYIGVEFACVFNNLGVEVTLSYRRDLFLRGFDLDARIHLRDAMLSKGIKLLFNHEIESIEKNADDSLLLADNLGQLHTADQVLYATGRMPKLNNLGLENCGITVDSAHKGINVDDNFQTSANNIYAVGDIINRVQLTPVALAEGTHVARRLFGNETPAPLNYSLIPKAVFTQPEIGSVGMTEEQAITSGYEVKIFRSLFTPMKYSFSEHKQKTLIKLIVDKASDKVLGAHMVGAEAGEIIQGIAIAVNMGATKAQFDQTIGIHPTTAEEFVTLRG